MTRTRTMARASASRVPDVPPQSPSAPHAPRLNRRPKLQFPRGQRCHGRLCNLKKVIASCCRTTTPVPDFSLCAPARVVPTICSFTTWHTVSRRSALHSNASMTRASMHGSKATLSQPSPPRSLRSNGPNSPNRKPQSLSGHAVLFGENTGTAYRCAR